MKQKIDYLVPEGDRKTLAKILNLMAKFNLTRPIKITVEVYKDTRSNSQNKLMWMWYDEIREQLLSVTGNAYTKDEIHEWFSEKYLPHTTVKILGEIHSFRKSTSKLKTSEMTDYLRIIEAVAASELDLQLTRPGDYMFAIYGKRLDQPAPQSLKMQPHQEPNP